MKICLDAGHYGKYNQSPCDKNYYESNMVWKLHLLLKKYLEEYGVEVIVTRQNQETDRILYDRGAASAGCVLFLSLHSNAVGNGINNSIDYPVAYCAINGAADKIGLKLAQVIQGVMGTKQTARIEHRTGSNGDYYGVIRGATVVGTPGLILEHSFHTNAAATAWLLLDSNLETLARAEAEAIALHYGFSKEKKSGWKEENGGFRYYLGNTGNYVVNDWVQDPADGKWYWFRGDGLMVANVWYQYKDHWFYLGSDGAMTKGLQTVSGKWYYLDQNGKMATEPVILTPDQDGSLLYSGLAKYS